LFWNILYRCWCSGIDSNVKINFACQLVQGQLCIIFALIIYHLTKGIDLHNSVTLGDWWENWSAQWKAWLCDKRPAIKLSRFTFFIDICWSTKGYIREWDIELIKKQTNGITYIKKAEKIKVVRYEHSSKSKYS
jgi:hypothetical protein